ncbi:uncharacterized protein AB9X84_011406 [Acanthopagrus schlegelii]
MVRLSLIVLCLLAAAWCFTGAAEGKEIMKCRGDFITMFCGGGKKVKVTEFLFFVGKKTCLKGKPYRNSDNTSCFNPFAAFDGKKLCDGKSYCAFILDKKTFKNVQPCGRDKRTNWTVKFKYTCV